MARVPRMGSRQKRLNLAYSRALQRDINREVDARIHRVAQVIHPVDLDHINVLRIEPVAGPRPAKAKRIAAVLEAATAEIALTDAKRVFAPKVGLVTIIGDASVLLGAL